MWTRIEGRIASLVALARSGSENLRGRAVRSRWVPALGVLAMWVLAAPVQAQTCAVGETAVPLGFTGGEQVVTVPADVYSATVHLSGAQGGNGISGNGNTAGSGGRGGRVQGVVAVTPGAVLSVWVGGQGSQAVNPGGLGGLNIGAGSARAGNGGGGTDLRIGGSDVANRIAIAAGGGGGGNAGWGGTSNGSVAGGTGGDSGAAGTAGVDVVGSTNGSGPFGGGGGAISVGGSAGAGCGVFPATAGAVSGDGGVTRNFGGGFLGNGAGGGGGGGATVGAGGGGAGVGTTSCVQNWTGGGGGGAGGVSDASGLASPVVSNGVQSGDGAALICFAPAAFSIAGTASGNVGSVTLQLDTTNPVSNQQVIVAAGQGGFTFPNPLPAGANWSVSIASAPADHTCSVVPNSGAGISADANNLVLTCTVSQAITNFAATPANPVYAANGTFALSATGGASGNPVVFGSNTPLVCTVAGNMVTMLSGGTCALTADQAGGGSYTAAPQVTLDVVIDTAAQAIIDFAATPTNPVFSANGEFAVSATGGASGNPVVFGSNTPSVCMVAGSTVTMLSAGACMLTADQAGNASFSAAPQVVLDVSIGMATQTITQFVANPTVPTYAPNGTFSVSATGGASGNPVVFASTAPTVCAVSGTTVTMLSAGGCALTANQAGSANYAAASQVSLNVTIAVATPVITWTGSLQKVVGEADFDLPVPTSTSSGAFTYTSSNPSVATVSGRTVTIVGGGVTTLTATQAAVGNYASGSTTATLTVAARPDPTRDPSVVDGLQAQVDASVRFAAAQQWNIRDRLRQLRAAEGDNASRNALTLNVAGAAGRGVSLPMDGKAMKTPTLPHGWGVWAAGAVTLGERDESARSSGFDFRSDGVSVGIDRRVGQRAVFGLVGGFGWNNTDFDATRSDMNADQRSLSAYGLWRIGDRVYMDGLVGWGRLDFDIARWSDVAGSTATAKREGDQGFASLGLGYEHRTAKTTVTGYGRFDASRTTLDAYRETGLGIYDLRYREQKVENSSVAAGLEGSYAGMWGQRAFRPFWTLEYRDALNNKGDVGINYVMQPVASDYLLGMRSYSENAFVLGGGFDVTLSAGWQLSLLYRREETSAADSSTFALRLVFGGAPIPSGQVVTTAP